MRAAYVITAAVVAAGLSAAGVTAASAGTLHHRGGGHPNGQTFTVVERALTDTTADTGPVGDSLGDVLAFANPIYDQANRKQLGSDNGSCIRTKVGATYECNWTVTLPGGSLVVEGPFYDRADSVLAVIGGTGTWSRAHGSMKLHARDAAGSSYDFTYTVQG